MCPVTGGIAAGSSALAAAQLGVSAASAAGGIASTVMGMQAQNERHEQNAQSAVDAYYLKAAAVNQRIRQTRQAAGQKKRDASLKRKRAQATAKAAAASGNVQGASVERLLEDYARSEGRYRSRVQQQSEASVSQLEQEKEGLQAEARNRINSVPPAGMEKLFGSTFEAGAQIFGAYKDYSETVRGEDKV